MYIHITNVLRLSYRTIIIYSLACYVNSFLMNKKDKALLMFMSMWWIERRVASDLFTRLRYSYYSSVHNLAYSFERSHSRFSLSLVSYCLMFVWSKYISLSLVDIHSIFFVSRRFSVDMDSDGNFCYSKVCLLILLLEIGSTRIEEGRKKAQRCLRPLSRCRFFLYFTFLSFSLSENNKMKLVPTCMSSTSAVSHFFPLCHNE